MIRRVSVTFIALVPEEELPPHTGDEAAMINTLDRLGKLQSIDSSDVVHAFLLDPRTT